MEGQQAVEVTVQGMQILSTLGFTGVAWYLLAVAGPRRDKECEDRHRENLNLFIATNKHLADTIDRMQARFETSLQSMNERADAQHVRVEAQFKIIAEKHEQAVKAIHEAQERQIDRVITALTKAS
jgi:molybdopterin-biosynthesis enzyme MoeA-like protein